MTADAQGEITPQRSQALATILPHIPILSSACAGWQGILVEYYSYPAYEIPAYLGNTKFPC